MSFNKLYIGDQIEDPQDLALVHRQIAKLGFDAVMEIPRTFAYWQVTEGLDIYYEVRESVDIDLKMKNQDVKASFTFRSIQEEYHSFKLIDIEAKLFSMAAGKMEKMAEKSFGETAGFPAKGQMLHQLVQMAPKLGIIIDMKTDNELGLADRFILGGELRKLGFQQYDKILDTSTPFLGDVRPGETVPKLSESRVVLMEMSHYTNLIDFYFSAERDKDNNALKLTRISTYAEVDPNELHNYTKVYNKDYKISQGPFPMKAQMEKETEGLIIADRSEMLRRMNENNTMPTVTSKLRI